MQSRAVIFCQKMSSCHAISPGAVSRRPNFLGIEFVTEVDCLFYACRVPR